MGDIRVTPSDLEQLGTAWLRDAGDFHSSVVSANADLQNGVQALAHPGAQAAAQEFTDRLHRTLVTIAQIQAALGYHLVAGARGYSGTDAANAHGISGGQR